MKIKLITDSACDLPIDFVKENNIDLATLTVNINGEFKVDDLGQTLKHKDFYSMVREGMMPSTAQVNVYTFEEMFRKYVEEGYSIIYIGLSSVLSGTFNSANIARENILEENKDADISVIDSISVSLGEGALVYYAAQMIKEGKSKEEIVSYIEETKNKIIHAIAVDDLSHLKRGGRISGATAAVGTLLNIKPTLQITKEGAVVPGTKLKGRKKVLRYIADEVKNKGVNIEDQVLFICHADCEEDALKLKDIIFEDVNPKAVIVSQIGAVIGTHGGPGTLAAVFIGNNRE